MVKPIIDFEMAEDVQEFIKCNSDVTYENLDCKYKILNADKSDVLKIVKTIESPTKIISVEIVNDEFVNKEL